MNTQWLWQSFYVGIGGFIGSLFRFGVSGFVHRLLPFATFPYGTLAVNVSGCLVIGILGGLAESRQVISPELRLFLFLGVLGGFTTFSTFGYETIELLRDAEHFRAAPKSGPAYRDRSAGGLARICFREGVMRRTVVGMVRKRSRRT